MYGIVLLEVTPEQSIKFKRYDEWYKLFEKGKYKGNFDNYCEDCENCEKSEYQKKCEKSEKTTYVKEKKEEKKSEYHKEREELLRKLNEYELKEYDKFKYEKLKKEYDEQALILKKLKQKVPRNVHWNDRMLCEVYNY